MKITLSKSQWEKIGEKTGWNKTSQSFKDFDHSDPRNYAPGQTPYTKPQWDRVKKMISDQIKSDDPSEKSRTPVIRNRAGIKKDIAKLIDEQSDKLSKEELIRRITVLVEELAKAR